MMPLVIFLKAICKVFKLIINTNASMSSGGKWICVVCGSRDVGLIIEGRTYCSKCGSKVIRLHMYKFLNRLKQENLIDPSVEIPKP